MVRFNVFDIVVPFIVGGIAIFLLALPYLVVYVIAEQRAWDDGKRSDVAFAVYLAPIAVAIALLVVWLVGAVLVSAFSNLTKPG